MDDSNPKSSWVALVAPNAEDANKDFICISVQENGTGMAKAYSIKGIPNLESGKSYTYKLKIGKDKAIIDNVTVTDWKEGTAIPGGEASVVTVESIKKSVAKQLASCKYDKNVILTLPSNASSSLFDAINTAIKNSGVEDGTVNLSLMGVMTIPEYAFNSLSGGAPGLLRVHLPDVTIIKRQAFIRNLHLRFQQLYLLCRQPRHIHDRCFIHSICQHLPANLNASLVHAFFYAFSSAFFHSFLVAVIYEGSFNAYGIPELVVGSELGIREAGNLQLFYGFSYLWVIEQVGRNLLCVGIDFREETEPQDHHALIGNGMRSELREFYEGEMQALDDLIAVLVMHDAVVVDEIRSIMRKDIIYQVERIHRLEFTVFSSLFSLTHIELGCIEQYSLLECVRPFHLHFHAELPASDICAEYIHNGILTPLRAVAQVL